MLSLAFSPDGKYLVSGGDDARIVIWDTVTRQPSGDPLQGHSAALVSLAFSPDGSLLASGGDDLEVRLWDLASRNVVVQTEIDSTLVARTLLSWTCDQRTVWLAGCTIDQMALHCRAVDLTIASRASVLTSASVVLRAAARVASLVSVPGAPLLMLPALVRLVEAAL